MKKVISFFVVFVFVSFLFAEEEKSLDQTLEELSGQAAKEYVRPIVSAFGTNLNGGWFHKAPKSKFLNIDVEFAMVFMGTTFPDDAKDFNVEGDFRFTESQAEKYLTQDFAGTPELQNILIDGIINQDFTVGMSGPTIVGSAEDSIRIDFEGYDIQYISPYTGQDTTSTLGALAIPLPVTGLLEDASMLPLFTPQLAVGTLYGTKLAFRYLPPFDLGDELGEFNYWGIGIQHNPKAYIFFPVPIDVCLSFFTQQMDLGNYITAKASTFGLNVSKQFGLKMFNITPYAGLMYETSTMEFSYQYLISDDIDPMNINFELEGENNYRLTIGSSFKLGMFHLNADYNIGDYNSFTAGFGVAF